VFGKMQKKRGIDALFSIVIHLTRARGIASGRRCFGRVMMGVRHGNMKQSE
jgi:hypothetical protein